ncbi:MAG: MG2 domain-containing protein, partial [Myxococcota bacterium]
MTTTKTLAAVALSTVALSCVKDGPTGGGGLSPSEPETTAELGEDGEKLPLPAVAAEDAPPASPRLELGDDAPRLDRIKNYFASQNDTQVYVQVDKPLYKPGETIWFRAWSLEKKSLEPSESGDYMFELVSPKGATVIRKRVERDAVAPTNDFEIPESVQGGEYKIRVRTPGGVTTERSIVVSAYEAPRIKKKLEFMRKAYGPGATVQATVEVKRPTGEPLVSHPLRPVATLSGQPLNIAPTKTNKKGEATVVFTLPKKIDTADGLLTVMVEDGGITESVSKRIPIILNKVQLSFFPEGGDLVSGLESRLYFEAKNSTGKPADVSGRILDSVGNAIAEFSTYHKGVGRLSFTPTPGQRYQAEITEPAGISLKYPLPIPTEDGCVLRTYDDLDGAESALRVRVSCS